MVIRISPSIIQSDLWKRQLMSTHTKHREYLNRNKVQCVELYYVRMSKSSCSVMSLSIRRSSSVWIYCTYRWVVFLNKILSFLYDMCISHTFYIRARITGTDRDLFLFYRCAYVNKGSVAELHLYRLMIRVYYQFLEKKKRSHFINRFSQVRARGWKLLSSTVDYRIEKRNFPIVLLHAYKRKTSNFSWCSYEYWTQYFERIIDTSEPLVLLMP